MLSDACWMRCTLMLRLMSPETGRHAGGLGWECQRLRIWGPKSVEIPVLEAEHGTLTLQDGSCCNWQSQGMTAVICDAQRNATRAGPARHRQKTCFHARSARHLGTEKRAATLYGIARSRERQRAEATVTMEIRVVEPQTAEPHQWKSRFSRDEVGLPMAWKKSTEGCPSNKRPRFEGGSEGRSMHDATSI